MASLCRKIDEAYANSDSPTKTQTEEAFGQMFAEMAGDFQWIIVFIGLAVGISLLCVSANAMAMALRERTTEIAVLKAIGFGKPLIVGLILAESVMIAGIGGLVGAIGIKLLCDYVDLSKYSAGMLPFFYVPWTTALGGLRRRPGDRRLQRARPGDPGLAALGRQRPAKGGLTRMVPLKYNVRNLRVRWVNTLMTVLGTGLIVWSSCGLFSLVEGLQHSLKLSGDPLDLIVLRKGSTSETISGIESDKSDKIVNLAGIARDESGQVLASGELLHIPVVERVGGGRANLIIRGIEPASEPGQKPVAETLRPDFKIVQGRDLEAGKGEAIVSRSMSRRFKGASLGGTLQVSPKESYRVVGLFTAGGSAAESEVWVDIKDLQQNTKREGFVSTVQLRADRLRGPRPAPQDDPGRPPVQAGRDPRGRVLRRAVADGRSSSRSPGSSSPSS